MARVSTYLNFQGNTEQAFEFYKSCFKTEYAGPIQRFGGMPTQPGQPPMSEKDKNMIIHVALPTLAGHVLMGTDSPESMGKLTFGNNVSINLEPDTLAETEALFKALSAGGKVETPLQLMFWGAHWGNIVDKFGVQWMFNCAATK